MIDQLCGSFMQAFSPFMVAAFLGYLVAQLSKIVISLINDRKFNWREVFRSGGMPSSHAATVFALATTVGISEGFGSPVFAVAFWFAIIVIYDATHVRRAVGEHGEIFRSLIDRDSKQEKKLAELTDNKASTKLKKPYFSRGHKPLEVIIGSILGMIIGTIVMMII